jgi:hypothetical protein
MLCSDLGVQRTGVEGDRVGECLGQVEGVAGGVGVGAVQVEDDALRVGQVGEWAESAGARGLQGREAVAQAGLRDGEYESVVLAVLVEDGGQRVCVDEGAWPGTTCSGSKEAIQSRARRVTWPQSGTGCQLGGQPSMTVSVRMPCGSLRAR